MSGVALGVASITRGIFIGVVDGFDPAMICLHIATKELTDLAKLLLAPTMEGLKITEDFTNAPCLASYNNVLYLFYPDGNTLKYATYSGTGWSTSPSTVTGASPACGASAVAFNGLLYVFYQWGGGNSATGGLWYNVFNGSSWSNPAQVPSVVMANSSATCSPAVTNNTPILNIPVPCQYASAPSAVVYNTQLYVFYQGSSGGQLWYTVFNGSAWIQNSLVSNAAMSCSPAAAVYNGDIYVLYQGANKNGQLWYSLYNGAWSNNQVSVSAGLSASPQVGVYDNDLVVIHQQGGNGTLIYYLYYDGSSWSPDTELTPIALSNSPGPVVFNSELYLAMQDKNQEGQLWYTGSDGSKAWSLMSQVGSGAIMSYSPGPITFNNSIYCFYNGPGMNGLLYYNKATVNWSWSALSSLNPIELSASPSTIYFDNQLICLFQDNSLLFSSIYNSVNNAWSPPCPLPLNIIGTASAVAFTPPGSIAAQLYIFYQAAGANGQVGELWYAVLDPTTSTCSQPVQISGVNMMANPSGVMFTPTGSADPELYVFYLSSGSLAYSVSADGTSWTSAITGIEIIESPSAAVFNNQVYVFYQGEQNSQGNLWYSTYDGSSWSSAIQREYVGMSASPSLTVFNNQLYIFHQGGQNCGQLWYSTLNPNGTWGGDIQVSNVSMSGSPAAVATNNQLYCFYEGPNANEQLWYSVLSTAGTWSSATLMSPSMSISGSSLVSYNNAIYCFFESYGQLLYCINAGGTNFWTTQMLVPGVALTGPASAILFDDLVYIFYQSASGGELWYVTYDDSTSSWSSPSQVAGATITGNPSAAVFNDALYVFYQGTTVGGQICYCLYNGSSWGVPVAPPIGGMSESPSAVVYTAPGSASSQLYVFYQGGGNSGTLFYNCFDGNNWSTNTEVPNTDMTDSPSAVAFNSGIYVFHQGWENNGQLWCNVFDGSSWAGDTQITSANLTGSPAAAVLNNYSLWVVYGNNSGQLSYNVCSGQLNWTTTPIQIYPNWSYKYLMSNYPSPVIFNGQLYVFFQDGQASGQLYYTSSPDGENWATPLEVPNTGMSGSPSAVAFNGSIYVFHQGFKQNGQLWCNIMSSNGTWGGDTQLLPGSRPSLMTNSDGTAATSMLMYSNSAGTGMGPSAIVFDGQIYCFWNEGYKDLNGACYYAVITASDSLTGQSGGCAVPVYCAESGDLFMYLSPAVVVYNNTIYAFFQLMGVSGTGDIDQSTTQLYYITSSNGSSWSSLTQAGYGKSAAGGNALAVIPNQIETIASPFVTTYLLPSNLMQTAIIGKDPETGLPKWQTPKWELAALE